MYLRKVSPSTQNVSPPTRDVSKCTRLARTQSGFTMAEVVVVIMVGSLIAAIAMLGIPRIMASIQGGKIIDEFSVAIPNIQLAYQNKSSFNKISTAQVANNRWLNSSFIEVDSSNKPTGNLITNWGNITFEPNSSDTQVKVTLDKIPTRVCLKIGEAMSNEYYVSASINGATIKTTARGEVDLDAIGQQCNSRDDNSIIFNFGRV